MELKYELNTPNTAAELLEGEVMAIDFEAGLYYSLRNSAATIWELLVNHYNIWEIVQELEPHLEQAATLVPAFVQDLVSSFSRCQVVPLLTTKQRVEFPIPKVFGLLPIQNCIGRNGRLSLFCSLAPSDLSRPSSMPKPQPSRMSKTRRNPLGAHLASVKGNSFTVTWPIIVFDNSQESADCITSSR